MQVVISFLALNKGYMHRFSPEGKRSLKALKENIETYSMLLDRVEEKWKGHSTAIAFAPDHGCHKWLGILGNHGERIPKDMNIRHFWTFIDKK